VLLVKLAVRNLMRHKRRTLLTAGIIAVAVFYFLLFDTLLVGMDEMAYDNLIDFDSGHIQVTTTGFWEDKEKLPVEHLLTAGPEILETAGSVEGLAGITGQLDFTARLNDGSEELPVRGRGIDPETIKEVFALEDYFIEGSLFKNGEYRVVMGKKLAELLELEVGDFITLLLRTKEDYFNTIDAEIAGFFHTPYPVINEYVVYVPLDIAQQALNAEGELSHLVLRLNHRARTETVASNLQAQLARYDDSLLAAPWYEQEAVAVSGAKNAGAQLILAIILMIAAIGIINAVILAALERKGEIGMMKAQGLQEKEIVLLFVLESAGIGILGGLAGCLAGIPGVGLLVKYGVDFTAMIDMEMSEYGIPILGAIYGRWMPKSFIFVFLYGFLVSLAAGILPAYWAARKDPVEAIYNR